MSRSKHSKEITSTRNYYDKKGHLWASRKTDSFFHEKQFTKFSQKLNKGSKVLDIGCSWGIHVPLFFGIGRHLKYSGTDISKTFLKLANRRYPQLSFKLGSITKIDSLPSGKFDGFLAVAILMHIPFKDWDTTFDNIEKKMRPGAIGYISLPVEHPSGENANNDPRHFTLLDDTEQISYLKNRNWKILHKGELDGYTVKSNWRWYIVQLP